MGERVKFNEILKSDKLGAKVWNPSGGAKMDGKLVGLTDHYLILSRVRIAQDGNFWGNVREDITVSVNDSISRQVEEKNISKGKGVSLEYLGSGDYELSRGTFEGEKLLEGL